PPTLTPEHQQQVQAFVHQLHEAAGKPHGTVWNEFKTAFAVAKYEQVPDAEWDKVATWFRVQLQRADKKREERSSMAVPPCPACRVRYEKYHTADGKVIQHCPIGYATVYASNIT